MKHSENLKKFLAKPRNKHYQRVYLKQFDDFGEPVTEWRPHHIYIGLADDGWLHGARLSSILCEDFQTWAFGFGDKVTDITDEFWKLYEQIGRCTFDRDHRMHFINDDDRYTMIGSTRRCNWCGQWHERKLEKQVRIERREVWHPQEAIAA